MATHKGKLSSTVAEALIHWRSDDSLPAPDFQIPFAPVYFWEHGLRKSGAPAMTMAVQGTLKELGVKLEDRSDATSWKFERPS